MMTQNVCFLSRFCGENFLRGRAQLSCFQRGSHNECIWIIAKIVYENQGLQL